MELIRTFIAIDIDENTLNKLVKFQELLSQLNCDIKFVERENIHLTLKFLGEIPLSKVDDVIEVMNNIKTPSFNLEVRGVGVFPSLSRPRVIWAGVGEGYSNVTEIFKILDLSLRELNFKSDKEEFTPHITIGRVRSNRNIYSLIKFMKEYEDIAFGVFNVNHVRLKKSVLTSRGPIYSNIHEVKLV